MHSASVRCANRVKTLIKLLIKSKLRLDPNKKASGVEILQNLRKKSQERIAKFPEFWRAKRTEFNFFFPGSVRCVNRMASPKLSTEKMSRLNLSRRAASR